MKDKLEDLPLFNGRNKKQHYDLDFTLRPDSVRRDVVFSIELKTINQLKAHCEANNLEPSEMVEALLSHYLKEASGS